MKSGKRIKVDGQTLTERVYSLIVDSFAAVRLPEAIITIAQGSWSGGVAASGSTHKGGGAVDISLRDVPDHLEEMLIVELRRRCGGPAWIRTPAQGFPKHLHMIVRDEDGLSSGARWQVKEYDAGRDGLSGKGSHKDYHPRPRWVPYVWPKVTPADDQEDDDVFIYQTHQDSLPDGEGIGNGAHYIVIGTQAVQCDKEYNVVGAPISRVLSSTEAMDQAFYDAVTLHKLPKK